MNGDVVAYSPPNATDETSENHQLEKPCPSYISEDLPRTVQESADSVFRSACELQQNSSTHIRTLQDHAVQHTTQYRSYEDLVIKKIKEEQKVNWLELPFDITFNILNRIGIIDILENGQKVCTAWNKICKDPAMWRVINMKELLKYSSVEKRLIYKMCKHAVDRSQGQLVDITIVDASISVDLLLYVTDRSSQLRCLELYFGRYVRIRWNEVLMKFPLLEELNLHSTSISKEAIESAGRYCPMLKTLRVNCYTAGFWEQEDNEIATAVGENLHELRHLQLIRNQMSDIGLQAILDGCPHLETLDLSDCWSIDPKGDVGRRCSQQIKLVILPYSCETDSSERSDSDYDSDYGCDYLDGYISL